jgi:hypothetical protein
MGPNTRGVGLTAEEHAARQICKVLGDGRIEAERLRTEWLAIRQETSGQRRQALGENDWDKVLAAALSRGWVTEQDGFISATEAGKLIGKRSRAATRKTRAARLRSRQF